MRKILLALILTTILLILPSFATVSDVSLISPVDNYNTTSTTPIFSFNATSNSSATLNCSLYLNDTSYANNDSVANVTDTNLTASTISTDGLYEWYITCTDTENSTNSTTRTITIDSTAPITTATAVDDAGSSYTFDTWTNSTYVNVTLSCDDGSGVGCDKTQYCLDTDNSCTPNLTYSTPVKIETENTGYIRYRSNDTLSNLETIKNQTIKIDTIDPEISWITTSGTYTVLDIMIAYNDTNNDTCRLIWAGTEEDFTNYNSTHYWSSKTLSGGRSYIARAYCNDSSSRTTYTDNITLIGQAGSSSGITGGSSAAIPTYKIMISMKPVKQFIQIYEDGDLVKSGYFTNGDAIWLEKGTYKFVFATDGKSVESTMKVDRDFTITNEMSTELYQTTSTTDGSKNWMIILFVGVIIAFVLYKKDLFKLK